MKMDGKNREEQENGAKVRDLEEYKAENRKRKRRRRITVGILAGAILAAGIGTGVWLQLRTFQGYDTVQATETEDTDTYMFQKSGNKIVRYGIDGIELRDRKNQTLWSDHYTMENPQMISCGDAIAIYDKNGTKIVVYDADGRAGEITASYPIMKASVAGQGVVAAILENNGESWIKYYNTDGTEIASSHPNMDSPGYPMDLSLSSDGLWMAVSYAYEDGGKMKSQVAFYNFGSRGEDLVDNLASSSSYTDMLCPQIETAGTSSWVAFFDNGFCVYEGTSKPKETVSVSEDGEILSCAYADDCVVLILRGESDDHPYRMKIYNLKGKQLADENLDFYYQNLQIEEKQILLTNRQEKKNMNWLRYVLLAVCILSALAGYRKGLVRTVLSMVFLILVTGLAIWMNPYVTDVLNERTTLPQYVEKKCLETFENNEFLSGENQDVQKKWLESMGVPEELVNQILGSGAVREYQEEQLHSLASYAAKAVSEKIMKGIAFFLTLVLAVVFVTIAVKIVELIAEIPGISFLNRMGGAGLGVVRAVLWIWIFFAVVYCFQATHWGNVCMKQIQGDPALAWIRENNPVLMLLKNVL